MGIFHIRGQSHLEFRVDPDKCKKFGVMTADVNNVVSSALGARAMSSMVEGEKLFDIAIRWPKGLRSSEMSILDIPVDIINNQVVPVPGARTSCRPVRRRPGRMPSLKGNQGGHVEPDRHQRAAAAAARPGDAAGRRRFCPIPTANSSATAPPTSIARTANA